MISLSSAVGVAVIELGMVVTPGPNMMYLVSRSLIQGRTAGLVSLGGVATGFLFYVLATAAGLSILFVAVPELFLAVKLAGAAYLLWLAYGIVRGTKNAFAPDADLPAHSRRRLYGMGLTTCLLNPKIALLFGALLPQFVRPDAGPTALQLVALGCIQVFIATVMNGMWVLLAARLSGWLRRSRRAEKGVRVGTAGLFTYFAVHLGLSRATA